MLPLPLQQAGGLPFECRATPSSSAVGTLPCSAFSWPTGTVDWSTRENVAPLSPHWRSIANHILRKAKILRGALRQKHALPALAFWPSRRRNGSHDFRTHSKPARRRGRTSSTTGILVGAVFLPAIIQSRLRLWVSLRALSGYGQRHQPS